MFERWTKRFATKATDGAVDGIKESLNDKLDTYSGIIKIGLTIGIIIFGSTKINDHRKKDTQSSSIQSSGYLYGHTYPQQPSVINNYITDGRHNPYGGQRKNRQQH